MIAVLLLAACGAEASPEPTTAPQPTDEPTAEDTTDDLPPPPEGEGGGDVRTFSIVEAEARFYIDEVLFGNDVTVEGVNTDVSGEVDVNYDDLSSVTFRPITIDANGFVTDNNNRNRAIQRFVLETGQAGNDSILFEVSSVEGLPEAATVGESYDVTIEGLLTVRGQSNPVTFTGTLTPVSQTRIEGSLSTGDIDYSQWGVTVPQPPSVTFVADTMRMEFDFTAEAE
jgi:polyisoprenoid-binding protein YceI